METKLSQQGLSESLQDKEELITVERIDKTPFTVVTNKQKDEKYLTIGNDVVMVGDTKEELIKAVEEKPWELIEKVIYVYIQKITNIPWEEMVKSLNKQDNE